MFIDSEDELPAEQMTLEQVVGCNVIDQEIEFPVLNDSEIDEFCEFINFSSHSDCDLIEPISPLSTGTLGEWGKNSNLKTLSEFKSPITVQIKGIVGDPPHS